MHPMHYPDTTRFLEGDFYEACRGLGNMARELHLPFVSGNVSFYNESMKTSVPPTPELVGVGIAPDIRKCVTSDLKREGNPIYLVGKQTEKEMGGSEYYKIMGIQGGDVPKTDTKILKKCMKGILSTIRKEYIASCHDVSEGGIGVCLSEMVIGGDIGIIVDLLKVNKNLRFDFKLFSESNTRWILEAKKQNEKDFEETLKKEDTAFIKIGITKGKKLIVNEEENKLINLDINSLRDIWKNTIWDIMG